MPNRGSLEWCALRHDMMATCGAAQFSTSPEGLQPATESRRESPAKPACHVLRRACGSGHLRLRASVPVSAHVLSTALTRGAFRGAVGIAGRVPAECGADCARTRRRVARQAGVRSQYLSPELSLSLGYWPWSSPALQHVLSTGSTLAHAASRTKQQEFADSVSA